MAKNTVIERKYALAEFLDIKDDILVSIDLGDESISYGELTELHNEAIDEAIEGDDETGTFTYGKEEYFVLTDKEADDKFKEYQQNLWDDIGLGSFSEDAKDYIIRNCVDNDKYFDDLKSDVENWIIDSPDSYTSYFNIDTMKEDIVKDIKKKGKDSKFINENTIYVDEDDYTDEKEDFDEKGFIEDAVGNVDLLDDDEVVNAIKEYGDISDYAGDATDNYIEQYKTAYDFLNELYGDDTEITKALEDYIDLDEVFDYVKDSDGRGPTLAGYDGDENEEGDYFIYRTN